MVTCQSHPVSDCLSVAWRHTSTLTPLLLLHCAKERITDTIEKEGDGREEEGNKIKKNMRELWNAANSYSRLILSEVILSKATN